MLFGADGETMALATLTVTSRVLNAINYTHSVGTIMRLVHRLNLRTDGSWL